MSRQITSKKCIWCSKEFRPWHSSKGIYCSNQCQRDYERDRRLHIVVSTKDWWQAWQHPQDIRRELIQQRGRQCAICMGHEWQGREIPLVMDHIDGNPENWQDSNLRLICCNCDAQTPTYKSKNRGHGRFMRRKRCREGKSY